jgi:prepilin-type N-terminal cleavage/methylation domain-containing protein
MRFKTYSMDKSEAKSQKGFTIIELMISTVIFSLVLLGASSGIVQIGKKYSKGITYSRTQEVARSTVDEIAQSLQFTSQSIRIPNYPEVVAGSGPASEYNIYNLLFASELSSGPVVLSNEPTPSVADTFYFCIGAKRYSFVLNKQIQTTDSHALWVDEPIAGCANANSMAPADMTQADPSNPSTEFPGNNGRELLDKNMRITNLSIIPRDIGLWVISVSIATGDSDLLLYTPYVDGATPTVDGRVSCEGSILSSEFCATSEISSNATKRIQ